MDKKEFNFSPADVNSSREYSGELPDLSEIDINVEKGKDLSENSIDQNSQTKETFESNIDKSEKKRSKLALKIGAAVAAIALLTVGGYESFKILSTPKASEANAQPNNKIESTQSSHTATQSTETTKPITGSNKSDSNNAVGGSSTESENTTKTNSNTETNSVNTQSENDSSNVTETEKTIEQLASAYEIESGLSSEEYGRAVVDVLEKWRNAGYLSDEEDSRLMSDWMNYNSVSLPDFAKAKAADYAKVFNKALLVSDYEQNTNLTKKSKELEAMNANSIHAHIYSELDKDNKDGFYMSIDTISVGELSRDSKERSIVIVINESINIEDLTSTDNPLTQTDGQPITYIINSISDGETEKITGIIPSTNAK